MLRSVGHVLLSALVVCAPVTAEARDISSWRLGLLDQTPERARRGLICRIIDARAGTIEVRIVDKAAQALFVQDDHGGFFLVRDFEKRDRGSFDSKDVPDSIRIDLFHGLSADDAERRAPLLSRPGHYWLASTTNYETEVENIEWIDACPFAVSGTTPEPNWRLSAAEIPADETQPRGLRCHIADPVAGIVDIEIADKRAHYIYLRDDHRGSYTIRTFERPDPLSRSGTSTFDPKRVPDRIRVNLFHDLDVPFPGDKRSSPVRLISRPGEYRIVSADDSDGELELTDWLGKCAVQVR